MSDHYPHETTARDGSPETAFEAAKSVTEAAKTREKKALRLIEAKAETGCTADEVACALDWERYSSRPRLSTMKARGEIVDSGRRREGVSGRKQVVWVLPKHAPEHIEVAA